MGLGYRGVCHLELEDEETAIYSYQGENWNLPVEVRQEVKQQQGMFTIQKCALEEPEIRVKRVRGRNGKKRWVEKRIMHSPDIHGHIEEGTVTIDAYCGADKLAMEGKGVYDRHPRWVMNLLDHVFQEYMEEGALPEWTGFIQ